MRGVSRSGSGWNIGIRTTKKTKHDEYIYTQFDCDRLSAITCLSWFFFRVYKKTTSTSDYLVGGRQMNPIVMALSYGATFISASAIVGFGGVAAAFGMGIQWLCFLNMFVGVVIAFIFFGLRTRRMGAKLNVSTFPQLLGRHFSLT